MITRLTNFIGNKKVISGVIFIIVILIVSYNIFFSNTKKEFDTDIDGTIDKVEYYHGEVKVKEIIIHNYSDPRCKIVIYWNKNDSINSIEMLISDIHRPYYKVVDIYDRKINFIDGFIKQKNIGTEVFFKEGKSTKTKEVGNSYVYSRNRRIFFMELDEKNKGMINKVILFDQNGRNAQTKEDKDSNGKFEYYEFYEHGKKTAVGYDYDEDGEIDKREEVKNKSH